MNAAVKFDARDQAINKMLTVLLGLLYFNCFASTNANSEWLKDDRAVFPVFSATREAYRSVEE